MAKHSIDATVPWSVPIRIEDVPPGGRRIELVADRDTRAQLARSVGVVGIERLNAVLDLSRQGNDRLRVIGELSAVVQQNCVVTLDPLESVVREPIEATFVPKDDTAVAGSSPPEVEITDEGPEMLVDGSADLGILVTQFLNLGIDPYPRKPGVAFEGPKTDENASNPFASLRALKDKMR